MVDFGSIGTFINKIAQENWIFSSYLNKKKTTALADPNQHPKIFGETIGDI